ncbi:MAG: septal ring lytic transglycosylase RlpA family protein [Spirochaetales bacterium]|nr:septal ring lytic transglycosylase RlpA family protein [Spirochaetales bacterium]
MKWILLLSVFLLGGIVCLSAEEGYASWYGGKFQGRKTANGEIFDTEKHTAAHKTLPFGTMVKVTSLETSQSTTVRINDRGPFVAGRIIDLSRIAAEEIGMVGAGTARVRLEILTRPEPANHYIIQVASFRNKDNAFVLGEKLKAKGFSVYYEVTAAGYTRTFVKHVSRDNLDAARQILADMGYPGPIVRELTTE